MSVSLERFDSTALSELGTTIRNAGIAGAGGAGFPSHAKWERIDEVAHLLVNAQESEPNYYMDKWLAREHAESFATLFDALLGEALETVVVAAKLKYREWFHDLEAATDATVYRPDDLPVEADAESGVVLAYTDDNYQLGMESILLQQVGDVVIGTDLPMDHGWIVQNVETVYRIYRTLEAGEPMTRKFVHVDGRVPHHRFLEVPVGTPASDLLAAADRSPGDLEGLTLLDGGPGWCFEIDAAPGAFGVRKRTNGLLVEEADRVADNTLGDGRVNVLEEDDWAGGDHETEPVRLDPDRVRIPMISNPAFEGVVAPSRPIVDVDDAVERGEMIATPAREGISNAQHASVAGRVTAVTETHVEIERDAERGRAAAGAESDGRGVRTWCAECGDYVPVPEAEIPLGGSRYVCEDCG